MALGELLGRDEEVAELDRWRAAAAGGEGRLVLIRGEPGIGKTRLAEEAAAHAAGTGALVAWGRCVEEAGAPALWPWRQVLDALGIDVTDLVDMGAAEADRRFLVFERVVRRLSEAATDRPVVLVLDDLQWADHASLLLLLHVARALPQAPVLIIGTFRATEPDGLSPVIAELARAHAARIDLDGLADDAVQRHLRAVSGTEVSRAVAEEVRAATGGNPFFVGEVARALRDGIWTGAVPATVRDVTRQRVARLSPACAELLRAGSVLGREFSTAPLAAVARVDVDSALAALDEATAAGLVEPGRVHGEHRFAHALVRDAIETDLPSARRLALHVAAARAIESLSAGALEPHLPDLARHWAAAAPAGHATEAAVWSERAGDAALRVLSYEEAARLFASALEVGGASRPPVDRCRLHLALARARYLEGDLTGCADASFAAADLARDVDRPDFLAEAALVLEAVGIPELNSRIYELCNEAIDRLGDDAEHGALRARLLAQLSHVCFYRGEHDRVAALSTEALALARGSGDDIALVAALRSRQEAVSGPEGRGEVGAVAGLMLEAGRRMRSPSVSMWGHIWRLDSLWAHGELLAAATEVERLAEQVALVGGPIARWHLARCRTAVAQSLGRLAEAHASALESREIMGALDPDTARRSYLAALTVIGRHGGLTEDQVALFIDEPPDPPPFTFATASRAMALVDAGLVDEARARIARLGPPTAWLLPPFLRVPIMAGAAQVLTGIGAPAGDVAAVQAMLAPYRGGHAVAGAGPFVYMGPIELYLGIAAAYLGELDDAVADLETAVDTASASGAVGYALDATVELARVLRQRAGPADQDRARQLAERAHAGARTLAMPGIARRADALLRPAAADDASPLTAREAEVATLVGHGRTNREIAEALFISERTAQNHVQHILTKLGFSRRSEIATWVARNE